MRQGIYWPRGMTDAEYIVKTCEACQFHAKNIHQPALDLQTIPIFWPFAVWVLDVVGNFPRAVGGYQYLIVAIDKFTKWIEVEPIRAQTAPVAIRFVRVIVCRFGVLNRIITDHGLLFTSGPFRAYWEQLGTRICYSSVAHPRSNGQGERANGEIVRGLKTRTFDRLKRVGVGWIDHILPVL